jgi:hypothetical protein
VVATFDTGRLGSKMSFNLWPSPEIRNVTFSGPNYAVEWAIRHWIEARNQAARESVAPAELALPRIDALRWKKTLKIGGKPLRAQTGQSLSESLGRGETWGVCQ